MKTIKSALFALLTVLMIPMAANAVPIVDQEHFVTSTNGFGNLSNGTTFGRAQTFTVGLAGIFDSIDVQVRSGGATQARIIATAGGAPIGGSGGSTVLATSSSVTNAGDVYTFDFSPSGLAVTVGQILAIELFGQGQWSGVTATGGGSYAGGSDYFFNTNFATPNWTINPNFDWNFRTYVDVSEPGIVALVLIGLLGMSLARRRNRT